MNRRRFLLGTASLALAPLAARLERILPAPDPSSTFGQGWDYTAQEGEAACIVGMEIHDMPAEGLIPYSAHWSTGERTLGYAKPYMWAGDQNPIRYVSHAGDDRNDGTTPRTAWRTLDHATETAPAGADVIVAPGTYSPGKVARNSPIQFHGMWAARA
jgi:hypothetical protein